MSVGRAVRLAQMLGLHRLDGDDSTGKNILAPPNDWIELEERRRTFWATFYGDRWASSGTGWPMVIDENDVSKLERYLKYSTNWAPDLDQPACV
jgi:Fungal specific transcription factor domain